MAKQNHHQAADMDIKQDIFMAAKDGNLSNLIESLPGLGKS